MKADATGFVLTAEERAGKTYYVAALPHNPQIRFVGESAEEACERLQTFLTHLARYNEFGWS